MNNLTQQTAASEALLKKKSYCELDSFFDHEEKESKDLKKLWIKPKKVHQTDVKNNLILESNFEKKGKKTSLWKTRFYLITETCLAYKENKKSSKIKKVMPLERVRVEYITHAEKNKPTKYGFRFIKNKQTAEIFTTDDDVYEEFKKEIEFRCVQVNFQERYQIEKMIGKGSFGRVYLVKKNGDGRQLAVKMFLKDAVSKQKKGKASLLNEIRILRMMDHPGVMRLYEVHETSIAIYLVVELLSGGELFDRLKEKRTYTENDCALMLKRIIEPLQYMHEKGIMHRDVKPENLIIRTKSSDFDIVLADFGLATEIKPKNVIHARCGTPGYCAPEILNSRSSKLDYDAKCDVFSIGCVFYHIMTGKNPFAGQDQRGVFNRNRKCEITVDDPKIQTFSPHAQDLLKSLLAKSPRDRPTLKEALEHKFFLETGKSAQDAALGLVKQVFVLRANSSDKRMSIEINGRDREREKEKEMMNSLVSGCSGADFGSFQIGRSNFFRGNMDTVNEVSMMTMGDMKQTMNLLPVSKSNLYGGESPPAHRRSSFSRYSMREHPSISLNPSMQKLGDGLRENPSITINGSIHNGFEGHSHRSFSRNSVHGDDGLLSASSRSNSKQHSNTKSNLNSFEDDSNDQENSILNPDGERSPVFREIRKLRSNSFHNPFDQDENNGESLVSLKMGILKSNTLSVKSIGQSRVLDEKRSLSKYETVNSLATHKSGKKLY